MPVFADYQSGLDAYNTGNYSKALHEWKAVVEAPSKETTAATLAETNYAIGMLYWVGLGVTKDYFTASKWMHKAGELGHAGAQGKLGFLYSLGIAVKTDKNEAFKWFNKAAKQGDVDGQYNLGIFYLNGWGTEQNKTMAAQYLAAASAQGDESAEIELQKLLPQISTLSRPNNISSSRPPSRDLPPNSTVPNEIPAQGRHDGVVLNASSRPPSRDLPTNSTVPNEIPAQGRHDGVVLNSSSRPPSRDLPTNSTVHMEIPGQARHDGEFVSRPKKTPSSRPPSRDLPTNSTVLNEIPGQARHDGEFVSRPQKTPSSRPPSRGLPTNSTVPNEIPAQGRHDGVVFNSSSQPPSRDLPMNSTVPNKVPNQARDDRVGLFLPETWILQQNPNHYTIQVIGLSSKSDLEQLLSDYTPLAPLATYTLQRSGKPLYLLIQGNYPDVEAARRARDNFPTRVQKQKQLWIRQFSKIQQLINAETGGQSE